MQGQERTHFIWTSMLTKMDLALVVEVGRSLGEQHPRAAAGAAAAAAVHTCMCE